MIYTFYSYKGGVGRSMALANLAKWFYMHGLRVVIVDWDLEAPGLESFFIDPEQSSAADQIRAVQNRPGLIDLLIRYQRRFPALPIPPWPKALTSVLESMLPSQLPAPWDHIDVKQLLKALELELSPGLRPAFDRIDTAVALQVLEKSLPAVLSGFSATREDLVRSLQESLPPTLVIPFEQVDTTALLKAMEAGWMATTPSPSSSMDSSGQSDAANVRLLLSVLAANLTPESTGSFDEAYIGPLLRLIEESLPPTLLLSTDMNTEAGMSERIEVKALTDWLSKSLPPDFTFSLRHEFAAALLKTLEETLPPFSAMLYPIYQGPYSEEGSEPAQSPLSEDEPQPGLWLLSAGWRFGERFPLYAQNVQTFDWTGFYNSFQGEAYFEWMRNQLNRFADVVLVDSRTGVTEMGGVCTRQLADVVVSFVAPNGQNLSGVATMVDSFRRKDVVQARRKWEDGSTSPDGSLEVVVIPARVETSEVDLRNKFEELFSAVDKPPAAFQKVKSSFWSLKIPYVPYYSYNEKIVIGISMGGKGRSEELEDAYKYLGAHLVILAPEQSVIRKRFAKDLQEAFPNLLPGMTLIAYARSEQEVARELCGKLEAEGIPLAEDLFAIPDGHSDGQQIIGAMDPCESIVIVVSPESVTSEPVLRQWRAARQQGKCVYLICRGLSSISESNRSRLPKSAEPFDLNSDWQRLAHKLGGPCQTTRAPRMAPPVPEQSFAHALDLARLKELLLTEDDLFSQRRSLADVAICAMGGSGKSTLAAAFCHDLAVQMYFDGGVLWTSLGANPDILAEMTKFLTALTGEQLMFPSADEACVALARTLVGQRCLMVVDDVWDKQDLRPFIRAGANCGLVITTRDQGLAAESADHLVSMQGIGTPEAVEIITSHLKSSSTDSEVHDQLVTLVERLGASPPAVELAGAELRRRVEHGDRTANAIEYLRQAIDVQGVVAFDTPGSEERSLSVAKSLNLSLDRLTEEERLRYSRLAEFDEHEQIPLAEISRKWGLHEVRAEQLVQRLGYLSLLTFDPERKTVTLHPLLRSYLIEQALLIPRKNEESGSRGESDNAGRARDILRGQSGQVKDLVALAMRLKGEKQFSLARRLLLRVRRDARLNENKQLQLKVIQQLSLCTRKDSDLPVDERLDLAFEILKETGDDLNATRNQETLGLAGAIFKNKWEVDGQKQHLERSLAYYMRGQKVGINTDDCGYTGINAAHVLDLIADQEAREAAQAGTTSESAKARRKEAEAIRQDIVERLPGLANQPGQEHLLKQWWFLVTLAEAFFGLKRYDQSLYWLKEAAALPKVPEWEYETTARQLASIARLQDEISDTSFSEGLKESKAWEVLRVFLKNDVDAVRSSFIGKIGLALSGGGFRASLFHIGVLAKLAELDALRRVEVLSCVSGGSIIGAHYYLEVRKLLEARPDTAINRQNYIEIVQRIEKDFLAGVQRNLRTRVTADILTNLKMIFLPNYSRTERVGELYEREIFSRVSKTRKPLYFNDLVVQPIDGPANFQPKSDNWRRATKVPVLILNATTLNTGHNWQFTTSWMGEPPAGIITEVDGNDRLRRMYYHQAPKPHNRIRLGHAVAASACVPGLFEPLALSNLYPEKMIRLVDGGVHDNQGVAGLLGEDCTVLLVSDASGQMGTLNNPGAGMFGVSLRSNSILMSRVRETEYRELDARQRSSLLRGLMFIHLKKDLEVDPVDWVGCDDPYETLDESHLSERRGPVTSYGVRKDVQESLSAIRTDLDSFSDTEAYALMLSGYRMAGHEFVQCIKGFPDPPDDRPEWTFLSIEKQMDRVRGFEDAHRSLMRSLNVGSSRAFKVWKLTPLLPVALVLTSVAGMAGVLWLYMTSPALQRFFSFVRQIILAGVIEIADFVIQLIESVSAVLISPLGAVVATVLALAILIFGWRILQTVRRYKPLTQIAIGLAMASFGWVAAGLHLHVFDKLYLRQGRVDNRR